MEEMASTLERLNNMLSWADSVVTEVSLLALLIICLVFSYAIKIFSSNLVRNYIMCISIGYKSASFHRYSL